MPDPAPTPTGTPAPAADPAPNAEPPAGEPADDGPVFTNDRDKRRWAELTGRLGTRERERDDARARVEALQWREVERLAGATLAVPSDIRLETPELADLLDDDGEVAPQKVAAVVAALVEQRPGLKQQPAPQPLPGAHGAPSHSGPQTLADAVQRIARGRL